MPPPLDGLISREDIAELSRSEGLILDDEARISILASSNSIDVQACPGSGKTTLIAAKLILLAKAWPYQSRGVCVLSHTNVAKDEIIERLIQSKTVEAQCLLSYPHFIGTIQEFVNRYIALPYIRSKNANEITVDNDEYVLNANKKLERNQFTWLRGTLNGLGDQTAIDGFLRETYRFISDDGVKINISRRPRPWRSDKNSRRAERDLTSLKNYLSSDGYFLFRDMYTQGTIALHSNDAISEALRGRFPYVFVDEMQDTQAHQDDLLCTVFRRDDPNQIFQRFGDPDQAIFHGIGNEEANTSFNEMARVNMSVVLDRSHRFDGSLARKIKPFSLNEIDLETELSDEALNVRAEAHAAGQEFAHKIILFDDQSRARVVECFADIVSAEFTRDTKSSPKFTVKVVGAVGAEIKDDNQLRLGNYWPGFNKVKSRKSFKENSLIEAVRFCRSSTSADVAGQYRTLTDAVIRLLRMAGKTDGDGKPYSATSLREWLRTRDQWNKFRVCMYALIDRNFELTQDFWDSVIPEVRNILTLGNLIGDAEGFLQFEEEVGLPENDEDQQDGAQQSINHLPENRLKHRDGFIIEASTIHGVKGETHHATLIVETKHHVFDLETMMPYLVGDFPDDDHLNRRLPEKPHSRREFKPNKVFLRQLYVAMSRPKHLLCLALHTEHVGDRAQRLMDIGWDVVPAAAPNTEEGARE